MQVTLNDIIVRRMSANEYPQVWLREQFLLANIKGLSKTYLDVKARPSYKKSVNPCHLKNTFLPDTGKAWRWAKVNGSFYYSFDNIPDKQPANYAAQLPSRSTLIQLAESTGKQKNDVPADSFIHNYVEQHYKEYYLEYGECTEQQQRNLSRAAAFLDAAAFLSKGMDKKELSQSAAEILKAGGFHYLPKHPRNIAALIQRVNDGEKITEIVKLHRAGNQNAAEHCNDEEIKSWIIQMRNRKDRNYSVAFIVRKIEWMCRIAEKPVPSVRWISDFATCHNTEWLTALNRYSEKGKHGQPWRDSITLKNAPFAGDCWQIDGTRVNFIDFKLNGKNVFLYIVAVRDVHSGDILGYAFDISENRWIVSNALKMAVEETGYLPYELQMDRFPGHNTDEMKTLLTEMELRGVKITVSHVSTGKAKLERWFSTLQQVFMMDSDYFYGEGVQSRNRFAHRSKEGLKMIRKAAISDGWNYDKAVAEACRIVEGYRNTSLKLYSRRYKFIEQSPCELHELSDKPNVKLLEPQQIIYLFGLRTEKKFTNNGLLNIEIAGYPFSYRCASPSIVSQHERVTVCYDVEDLDTVHLYEISDRPLKKYLGTAHESSVQMYGPDAEWGKLNEQKAIIRNMNAAQQLELSMKLAVGSEFNLLMQGEIPKAEYEQSETMYLVSELGGNSNDESAIDDYDIINQL